MGKPGQEYRPRGQGKGIAFLREHLTDADGDCLIWPWTRRPTGYGCMGFEGKTYYPHRFMCELVNGPAPSEKHEASHSCGRGHDGCVHPRHLSWKTRTENQADRWLHGTAGLGHGPRYKLTAEDVAEIIRLKGKEKTVDIAKRFGVSRGSIRQIHLGQTWVNSSRPRAKKLREIMSAMGAEAVR